MTGTDFILCPALGEHLYFPLTIKFCYKASTLCDLFICHGLFPPQLLTPVNLLFSNTIFLPLLTLMCFFFFCQYFFGSAAIRFSPSKRTRTSIPALKSSSQEILSSQADERREDERRDRLGGARSLASLDGQGA